MEAQPNNQRRVLIGLGAAAAIVGLVLAVLALTGDDDDVSSDATTTTEATTTSETTSSTEGTTTSAFQGVDPDVPIYPDPTTSQRFTDPDAAARAFATDFIGYSSPVFGAFEQGDGRSGEIEVRSGPDAAPSVVLLRQLEDDAWYVVGVTTDSIRLTTPKVGDTLTSPQPLKGQAYAFEGTVNVLLYADGVQEPIGETTVTGRGDGVLGDFSGEIGFTNDTGATNGVLVLLSRSEKDGAPVEMTAIRVRL